MPTGHYVDLDALQRMLYERADRRGVLKLNQARLAEELGITKFTMSRTIARMLDEKRLKLVSSNRQNSGKFRITDPDDWDGMFDGD